MAIVFLRSLLLYTFVMIAMRVMGKRQIGELQPSEFVVTIMISEFAAFPAQITTLPIISAIVPITTLVICEIVVSYFAMKSPKIRNIVSGKPSVVIKNGKVDYKEMEKIRMNMDDLIEELRLANCEKIKDVKRAIVETNGKLSVSQKGGNS